MLVGGAEEMVDPLLINGVIKMGVYSEDFPKPFE